MPAAIDLHATSPSPDPAMMRHSRPAADHGPVPQGSGQAGSWTRCAPRWLSGALLVLGLGLGPAAPGASAQLAGQRIEELEGVEIEQHLEARLPLDARFVDQGGGATTLGASFGPVPVVLTLNYVDCPQLCSLQLSQLAEALGAIGLGLGEDFRVVTVSIEPTDTPERLRQMRDRYVDEYLAASKDAGHERDRAAAIAGWTVLVGERLEIDRVAETVGFGYRWVPSKEEYAHQAANILCSPGGVVTRYLPGVSVDMAETLRLSLLEAGEGTIGTLFENVFLNCFIWDPNTGQYTPAALRLLKVAAALTVIAVATGIFFMKRSEAQQGDDRPAASANGGEQRS